MMEDRAYLNPDKPSGSQSQSVIHNGTARGSRLVRQQRLDTAVFFVVVV